MLPPAGSDLDTFRTSSTVRAAIAVALGILVIASHFLHTATPQVQAESAGEEAFYAERKRIAVEFGFDRPDVFYLGQGLLRSDANGCTAVSMTFRHSRSL